MTCSQICYYEFMMHRNKSVKHASFEEIRNWQFAADGERDFTYIVMNERTMNGTVITV